jgi:hypothetical protein
MYNFQFLVHCNLLLLQPKTGWTSDNIDEIKYDFDKKLLTFSSLRLAPLALIQDRCTDYPYASWELRCTDGQKAILDIKGILKYIVLQMKYNNY